METETLYNDGNQQLNSETERAPERIKSALKQTAMVVRKKLTDMIVTTC